MPKNIKIDETGKTVVILTYNRLPEFEPGWHHTKNNRNKLLIINGAKIISENEHFEKNMIAHDEAIIDIWDQLSKLTFGEKIYHIVVYLGKYAAEMTIGMASRMPAEKMIYLLCPCSLENKKNIITAMGHHSSKQIICECHGVETFTEMCQKFIDT